MDEPCFLLEASDELLVASGIARRFDGLVPSGSGPSILRGVGVAPTDSGEGSAADVLVGALPFDRDLGPYLIQPRSWQRCRGPDPAPRARAPVAGGGPMRVRPTPSRSGYVEIVRAALRELRASGAQPSSLSKVVLARRLTVEAAEAIDVGRVLENLRGGLATTFSFSLPAESGRPRHLVGASPELLVEKRGSRVASVPLAGSAPRSDDPGEDRAVAERLLRSAKDLREHALVVEHVRDTLAPYCRTLRVDEVPRLTSTSTMWHLATHVDGELRDPAVCALELARALHPTPAVCGTPREPARRLIRALEPFDRGFYAGAVGWVDGRGDGRWMVTIRCAEVAGSTAQLYAGAGLVARSDPEAEADETSAKFLTLLRALGVDEEGRPLPEETT